MASRRLCAVALVVTAVIHLAVVPEHVREWRAAAVFFIALTTVEVVLAVGVLLWANRALLTAGAAISVASALLWAVSRTVGLPVGPDAFSPEGIAAPDLAATALEIFAGAVFARMAIRTTAVGTPARAHH
jgi:hypothetical protein